MKGIVITADGSICIKDFAYPIYRSVGATVGGYIEHVKPARLPEPLCMLVNEDGINLHLPMNLVGSHLYRTELHGFPIRGDIVIMQDGIYHGEHDIIGIPEDEAAALAARFKQKYHLRMKEDS